MELKIEYVPIGELRPFAGNPRKISEEGLKKLQGLIGEFGFVNPVLCWRNGVTLEIVAGHQRVKAALAKGVERVPIVVLPFKDWHKAYAYNIADNRSQDESEWDYPKLKDLIGELDDGSLNLELTGFDLDELEDIVGAGTGEDSPAPEAQEGKAAELRQKWGVEGGQIWEIPSKHLSLKTHRILCGDATKDIEVDRLMLGDQAAMVFTDPPYGVNYQAKGGKFEVLEGDEKGGDELVNALLYPALKIMARVTTPRAAFYIWHASSTREEFAYAMKMAGLLERQYIIWAKPAFVPGWGDYKWGHEPCFYASKDGESALFYGDRAQSTVWRVGIKTVDAVAMILGSGVLLRDGKGGNLYIKGKAPKSQKIRNIRLEVGQAVLIADNDKASDLWEVGHDRMGDHPTQKPVELARRAIANSSREGEVVLDSFLLRGTSLVASEQLGRVCYGAEIDPGYIAVILQRAADMGLEPRLAGHGG